MSQDNQTATEILSKPGFATNLNRWYEKKLVMDSLAGLDKIRDKNKIRDRVIDLFKRKPKLFSSVRARGWSVNEIADYYYNQFVTYVR